MSDQVSRGEHEDVLRRLSGVETAKKTRFPWWSLLPVAVGLLVGMAGYVYGQVQKSADVEHRVMAQEIKVLDERVTSDEQLLGVTTSNMADVLQRMKAIESQTQYIPRILTLLMDGRAPR